MERGSLSIGTATRVMAGSFGLTAFAVAVIAGLAAGNTASHILLQAIVSMLVCHVVGLILGGLAEHVVREHLRACATPNLETGHSPDVNMNIQNTTSSEQTVDKE